MKKKYPKSSEKSKAKVLDADFSPWHSPSLQSFFFLDLSASLQESLTEKPWPCGREGHVLLYVFHLKEFACFFSS